MDAELVALASSAATAVVAAMATDGWPALRSRIARLFGRGDVRAEQLTLEMLDEDATTVTPGTAPDVAAAWAVRLRDLLRAHPELAGELRTFVEPQLPSVTASGGGIAAGRDVRIEASNGAVAAGIIHGSVNIGGPTPPVPGRA